MDVVWKAWALGPHMAQSKTSDDAVRKENTAPHVGHLSLDLIVMAAAVGIGRALFGEKGNVIARTLEGAGDAMSGHRGRGAHKPSEIPARGWKESSGASSVECRRTAFCS
jgi:hypothetical protein